MQMSQQILSFLDAMNPSGQRFTLSENGFQQIRTELIGRLAQLSVSVPNATETLLYSGELKVAKGEQKGPRSIKVSAAAIRACSAFAYGLGLSRM